MANYPDYNLTGKYIGDVYSNFIEYYTSSGVNTFTNGVGDSVLDLNTFHFPLAKTSSYSLSCISSSVSNTASYSNKANNSNYSNTNIFSISSSIANSLFGVKKSLFKKGDSTVPIFDIVNLTGSLQTHSSLMVYINYNTVANFPISTSVIMPTLMLGGNDVGIYATYDNKLIATTCSYSGYLTPVGYDNTNSKLIGGFYFSHSGSSNITSLTRSRLNNISYITASSGHGLVTGDYVDVTLMTDSTYNVIDTQITVNGDIISYIDSGSNESNISDTAGRIWKVNNTGIINQYSIWDLKFKPNCNDPRGMVLVDNRFWVDIWCTGVNYNTSGSSHKGDIICDGASPAVRSPNLGGNGTTKYGSLTWWEASEITSYVGKRLLSYEEYAIAGYGINEASSFGVDPVVNCRCIGYTSIWGCEEMGGVMIVWGRDLNYRFDFNTTINATYRSRTSGVALITSSAAHNLAVGDVIMLQSFGATSYNKTLTTVTSVPSTTTFTYNCAGTDEGLTSDTAGRIYKDIPIFNYLNAAGGRGQIYVQGPLGLVAGLYGGFWSNGASAGSRRSSWSIYVWNNIFNIGLRGCCDHFVVP